MSQIQLYGPPSGAPIGDVTGPASSTDNAVVRWDGITGKLIQNSNAILSDAGLLTLAVPLPVGSGGLGIATVPTNGQIPIGNGTNYVAAAPTSTGGTVTITLGAGTLNFEVAASGFTWNTVVGVSQTVAARNGYINSNVALTTYLLPAVAAVGDTFQLAGFGAGGWILTQNAGQVIHYNSSDTTVGVAGSIASTNRYNTIEVMCIVANTDWTVLDSSGTLTVV